MIGSGVRGLGVQVDRTQHLTDSGGMEGNVPVQLEPFGDVAMIGFQGHFRNHG